MNKLEKTIQTLRSKEGCPWDQELTLKSLGKLTIEEVYELLDAIEKDDAEKIIDELADLLTHLLFYFEIGETENYYKKEDVIAHANKKLISRHPHVFDKNNDMKIKTAEDVTKNWNKFKGEESKLSDDLDFFGPSHIIAQRIIKKIIELGININESQISKKLLIDPKNQLFYIYYFLIQNNINPEEELRKKIIDLRDRFLIIENAENKKIEDLKEEEIRKILFQN